MKNSTLAIAVVIVAVAAAAVAFSTNIRGGPATANANSANSNAAQGGGTRLQDTPYYNYAYLISGDILSADAQSAIAGFQMSKQTLPDGSVQINLAAMRSGYTSQSYTLKSGQKLYFIETSMGDDFQDSDTNLGDDMAVVVDSNGFIVQ